MTCRDPKLMLFIFIFAFLDSFYLHIFGVLSSYEFGSFAMVLPNGFLSDRRRGYIVGGDP